MCLSHRSICRAVVVSVVLSVLPSFSDAGWRLVEVVFKSSVLRLVELDPYLTGWRFDLSSLYPTAHASLASLSPPFSPEEIRRAFSSMKNI